MEDFGSAVAVHRSVEKVSAPVKRKLGVTNCQQQHTIPKPATHHNALRHLQIQPHISPSYCWAGIDAVLRIDETRSAPEKGWSEVINEGGIKDYVPENV